MTRPTTTGKAQDLITFTRSTTGTALAKISYGEELVTNGDFSAGTTGWSSYRGAALSASGGSFVVSADTGSYGGSGSQGITTVAGKTYTLSFQFISATGSNSYVAVRTNPNVGVGTTIAFVTTSGLSAGMHSATFTATGTTTYITVVAQNPNDVTTVDNISVKEVSFDQPDGTLQLFNHPINKPRIEYDAEGNCLGLLVEEGRTNLVTQSEFASGYGNHYLPLTRNQTASPDTNINAASAVPTAVNSEHYLEYVLSSPSSGTYTQSVFVKANGYSKVALTPVHVGADQGATSTAQFDLTEGTSTQSGSAVPYISNLGNGWYRIAITYTATGTVTNHRFRVQVLSDSYGYVWQANGADGIYVYGAQLETGSFPTSYIPTSGSAVTRSADVASLAVSEFGYNQDQGSFVIKFDYNDPQNVGTKFLLSSTSSSRFAYTNGNTSTFYSYDGVTSLNYGSLSGDGTQYILATGMDSAGSVGVVNGGTLSTSTATPQDNVSTNIYIGSSAGTNQFLSAHIKSVQYYPLRLSNAQLQALTI